MTITGKTAYIVTPDLMNSGVEREKDIRVRLDSGILGYDYGNQVVRFNVMVVLDAANDIDNLFETGGSKNPIASVILSAAKKRIAYAGHPIGSKQKDYVQFVLSENTLQVVLRKKSAFIGAIHNAVIEILGKFCREEVIGKKIWKLNLTQKDTLISGVALNKAQDVATKISRIEVLAGDNVNLLEAQTEEVESEKARRREYLKKKFKHAVDAFGKAGTRSNYPGVPKEQQLSIDLGNKPAFGIVSKILHWVENKFKYFFPRYNLFPEVGNKDRKIPRTNSQVKYFNQEEQAEHTLHIKKKDDEIKLYNVKGELYDTTDKVSKGRKGYVAYVITLDGRLITHEHITVGKSRYAYRHSTLAGGKPVLCSGLMIVKNGKIEYIDNNSGHYKPRSANIYNAIIRFKAAFLPNAKVVHFGGWLSFIKEIPILCRIVPDKKESIDDFQQRMEKKGKSGLNKVEECFKKIREYNKQYEQKLFLGTYKSPTSEPPNNPSIHKKHKVKLSSHIKHYKFLEEFDENSEVRRMTIEHSIRKIIGANFGRKPRIELTRKRVDKNEEAGVNIIFYHKDDHEKFVNLLYYKGCHYTSLVIQEKLFEVSGVVRKAKEYIVYMDEISADKFKKNTLKIDRSIGTILSDLELLCEESNSRTI
ncbi:Hypothetical protein CINCED_3A001672 [Cinara cedri]|uniref:Uncharacterized protein n=1 Tax=Cinara cedri TaxID=506608 RepID=A0A5E4MS70_9HEMI|nr:Hypothetical protein CINCED_3A001672 [Cinara cedri]